MSKGRMTIVVTIKNEEDSIDSLMESIMAQTLKPDEVIVAMAISNDETEKILNSYKKKIIGLRVLKIGDKNRSVGRNMAIAASKADVIAVTDAGCILDKNWLKEITKPILSGRAESVAGYYRIKTDNEFQKSMAPFLAVMPDKLDKKTYLASSRSVAFTRKAWQEAGKYDEGNSYSEDIAFGQSLKSKTKNVVSDKAMVEWAMPSTLDEFFHKVANYARGDVKVWYSPHIRKIASMWARYLVFVVLPPLFVVYLVWATGRNYDYVRSKWALVYIPILRVVTDVAIMWGSLTAK